MSQLARAQLLNVVQPWLTAVRSADEYVPRPVTVLQPFVKG